MSIPVLEATLLNSPHDLRWQRCAHCTTVEYQLCERCASAYGGGLDAPVCDACTGNRGLAGHRQRHSDSLGRCLDAAVCDLVEAIVAFGPTTIGSCAGAPHIALGRPYVGFSTLSGVEAVLAAALAAVEDDSPLEARIAGLPTVPAPDRWTVTMMVSLAEGRLILWPHLDLPSADVRWLTDVLRSAAPPALDETC